LTFTVNIFINVSLTPVKIFVGVQMNRDTNNEYVFVEALIATCLHEKQV